MVKHRTDIHLVLPRRFDALRRSIRPCISYPSAFVII
jgi:hypothetical protein